MLPLEATYFEVYKTFLASFKDYCKLISNKMQHQLPTDMGRIEYTMYIICNRYILLIILLIRDMVVESCNRRFSRETIHPTQVYFNELHDNIGTKKISLQTKKKSKNRPFFSLFLYFLFIFILTLKFLSLVSFHANLKNVN